MPRPKKEKPNHAGGLYEVKITTGQTFDGKLIRKSFYSSISKEDARKQAEEWKIQQEVAERMGVGFVEKDVTFEKCALLWLETYKKGKVKDNTYRGTYENPIKKHLIPYFGTASLKDIRPIDIQAFFDHRAKNYAIETQKKMRTCLSNIFDLALENDWCYKNPVTKRIVLTSEKEEIKKDTYSQIEYDKIYNFAKEHQKGLGILILLETGITRSELLGLRREDIDFDGAVINVKEGVVSQKSTKTDKWEIVSDGLKNSYRERPIPISRYLCNLIKAVPETISIGGNKKKGILPTLVKTERLIYNKVGKAYEPNNWMHRIYTPFMEDMNARLNIKILNPHELRHTRATLWKNQHVDIFSIAKLMGHSDLDMLAKRYAHNDVEALKEALGIA